ncbi:MAG: TonB-system energizer ExbB [Thiotrichales bacterium]|nr:TonB-system energizer ExbB [Thiotrichales bacterium]
MELLKLYLDFAIFGILGLMGFIALWITIERTLFFKRLNLAEFSQVELLHVSITKNLTTLSTIGANAPYVGLLGTVLGILITFYDLGQQQTIDTGSIMTGLALALKATAAGIAIAIPAIMSYNGLMRRCDVIELQFKAKHA